MFFVSMLKDKTYNPHEQTHTQRKHKKSKGPSLSESEDEAVIGIPQCTIGKKVTFIKQTKCVSKEMLKGPLTARSMCPKRKMVSSITQNPNKIRKIATKNKKETKNNKQTKNKKETKNNNANNNNRNNNNAHNAHSTVANINIATDHSAENNMRDDINDLLYDAMNDNMSDDNDNNANNNNNTNNNNKSNEYVDWFDTSKIGTAVVMSRDLQKIQNMLADSDLSPEIQNRVMRYINALLSGKWAYFINGEVLVLADLDTSTNTVNVCFFLFFRCEIACYFFGCEIACYHFFFSLFFVLPAWLAC